MYILSHIVLSSRLYSQRAQADALRSSDRVKNTLDVTQSERSQLERVRQTLNDQIDALTAENSKLQVRCIAA